MRKIGLTGGMNWESTIEYYEGINRRIQERAGGWHSAELILYSVNFHSLLELQQNGDWKTIAQQFINIAKIIEKAGADGLVLCSNTIHKIVPAIEKNITIPLLHIVDPVGDAILRKNLCQVGLLGTRTTMNDPFYTTRLTEKFSINALTPAEPDQIEINRIIYDELAKNIKSPTSKQFLIDQIESLISRGAQGIILGCTDLPRVIKQKEILCPVFDSMEIFLDMVASFILTE